MTHQEELIKDFFHDRMEEAYGDFIKTPEYAIYKKKNMAREAIIQLAAPEHTELLGGYFSTYSTLHGLLGDYLYRRGFSDCLTYPKIIGALF